MAGKVFKYRAEGAVVAYPIGLCGQPPMRTSVSASHGSPFPIRGRCTWFSFASHRVWSCLG